VCEINKKISLLQDFWPYFTKRQYINNIFQTFDATVCPVLCIFAQIFILKMNTATDIFQALSAIFNSHFGYLPQSMTPLAGGGGDRQYFRISHETKSAVGVYGENLTENQHFISLAKSLRKAGVNVPQIYGVSPDGRYYLQEDVGDTSLFSMLSDNEKQESLVAECMRALPSLQLASGVEWHSLCRPFGHRMILRDLNYMKYCLLKPSGVDPDEDLIDDDFELMANRLSTVDDAYLGLMYRDCQSRNVMVKGDTPVWIDFQSARRGPVLYDVASFLWQARAGFSDDFKKRMSEIYIQKYCAFKSEADPEVMRRMLPEYVLLRVLQTLGAYGFRGLIEQKAHFLQSIKPALKNVEELLLSGICDLYPELKRALQALLHSSMAVELSKDTDTDKLTVQVFSFSYKKGYPKDYTGNGGGFMFDCRGMHNPGRYTEYRQLTGKDRPVIDFLEAKGEVQTFLQSAWLTVQPTVDCFLRRSFSNLQIGFGCTGGQHRSVYCAEKMAHILKKQYGDKVIVLLRHREQDLSSTL